MSIRIINTKSIMKKLRPTAFVVVPLALAGCMNMPTPPSQITSAYVSDLTYQRYDCPQLSAELDSLARRENQLTAAQNQRIKTSQMQAFWWGYGQGDGLAASELATVRGEKEAVRTALNTKECSGAVRATQATRHAAKVKLNNDALEAK